MAETKRPEAGFAFSEAVCGPASGKLIADQKRASADMESVILPMLKDNPQLALELLQAALGVEGRKGGVQGFVQNALLEILEQNPELTSGLIIHPSYASKSSVKVPFKNLGHIQGPIAPRRCAEQRRARADMESVILPMLADNPQLAAELLRAALSVEGQDGGIRDDIRLALQEMLLTNPEMISGLVIQRGSATQNTPSMNI